MHDRSQGSARPRAFARRHTLCDDKVDYAHPDQRKRPILRHSAHTQSLPGAYLPLPIPPLRLEQPEDLYAAVPSCWWSRRRWVATGLALYDLLYVELREALRAPSVSRNTFLAWLIAESGCADLVTGRECRPSVRLLSQRIERHPRTVKRCRQLAGLLDLRQVVVTGRHRTKIERLLSWKRGDRARGWTAEAALIQSPAYAHLVDNSIIESLLEQDFVTPLPRSGGSLVLSRWMKIQSPQNMKERRAPRGIDRKGRPRRPRAYDQRAVLLASRVRTDARFPGWVRRMGVQGLAAVLTRRAVAGWQADDVLAALDQVYISGKTIFDRQRDPHAYLAWLLKPVPIDEPPMLLDRARETALELEHQAVLRAEREARRAQAMAATPASEDSPGRVAARAIATAAGQHAISTTAAARARAEDARRELARRARNH